jgi:hypothetical protein
MYAKSEFSLNLNIYDEYSLNMHIYTGFYWGIYTMFQASIILLLYYVLNLVMIINLSVNCSIKNVIICGIFLPSILICFPFLTSRLFCFRLCFLSSSMTCMNIYWWLWFLCSSMTSVKYYWTPIP